MPAGASCAQSRRRGARAGASRGRVSGARRAACPSPGSPGGSEATAASHPGAAVGGTAGVPGPGTGSSAPSSPPSAPVVPAGRCAPGTRAPRGAPERGHRWQQRVSDAGRCGPDLRVFRQAPFWWERPREPPSRPTPPGRRGAGFFPPTSSRRELPRESGAASLGPRSGGWGPCRPL